MFRVNALRMVAVMALLGAVFAGGCGGAQETEPVATPEAPATAPAEAPAADASGDAEFVQTKCTMCHTYDRVASRVEDEAGWTAIVTEMQQKGLVVTDEEKARIIAFLAAQ